MLSVIIISPDEKFRDNTRKLLEGADLIEVRTELNNFNSALDSWRAKEIKSMESVITIVDVTPVKEHGFQTIQKTIELYKHSYVFVAGDRTDRNLILSCMRAGAKEWHPPRGASRLVQPGVHGLHRCSWATGLLVRRSKRKEVRVRDT